MLREKLWGVSNHGEDVLPLPKKKESGGGISLSYPEGGAEKVLPCLERGRGQKVSNPQVSHSVALSHY